MRIYWCERHKLQAREPDHCEDGSEDAPRDDWCVVVPMRLIPDNDEYDEQIRERIKDVFRKELLSTHPRLVAAVLAALDGETQ